MSLFKIHEKMNLQVFRIFNLISDIVFWSNLGLRSLLKKNAAFKNIHEGKRCFILATGPSLAGLSAEQVAKFGSEYVFGVNSTYKAPVVDSITPSYYALMDNNYWGRSSQTFEEIRSKYKHKPPVFITDVRAKSFIPDGVKSIPLYAKNYPTKTMRSELDGNLSITMNVVGFAILSAIYMGFKEIYLLGCDYNLFCAQSGNHCYDDSREMSTLPTYNLAFHLKDYHLTTEFHYLIAKTAREKEVEIVNLTEGSLLDAYPAKKLSQIL